jgi:hypothetical protein
MIRIGIVACVLLMLPIAARADCVIGATGAIDTGHNCTVGQTLPVINTIASGSSNTLSSLTSTTTIENWNSASGLPKGDTIPGCVSGLNGYVIIEKDTFGDAATNAITVTLTSGTIDGGSSYTLIRQNKVAVKLTCDGAHTNWLVL